MKRVLSVWMAAARDVLWKLLLILIAMTGAELLLLRRGFAEVEWLLAEGYGSMTFGDAITESKIAFVYFLAFAAVVAVCCLQGCRFSGKNVYTLQRLPMGEVPATLLWAVTHLMCLAILWAAQLVLMLWFWRMFAMRFGAENPALELFMVFYENGLLHSLLPLADTGRWCTIGIYFATVAFSTACFGFFQRRGRFRGEICILAALFSLSLTRKAGMDGDAICMVICGVLAATQIAALWEVYHGEEA